MVILQPSQYEQTLSLLKQENIDIVHAQMVLEQKEFGTVYVDTEKNPSSFLIIHMRSGFGILFGKNDNDTFNQDVKNLLLNIGGYSSKFKIFTSKIPWEATIEGFLGSQLVNNELIVQNGLSCSTNNVIKRERVKFSFDQKIFESSLTSIPEGFLTERINKDLIERISGSVIPNFSWSSNENFLEHGIGFCLMKNEEIISLAFSAFITRDMIDIGIETAKDYRGKGLGFFPAMEMVKYCIENGYRPIWGCRKDNLASQRLAQKLGFIKELSHPWYFSATA